MAKPVRRAGRKTRYRLWKVERELRVDRESEAFKALEHAYAHGRRVSTAGMSREEFKEALFGGGRKAGEGQGS